MHLQLAHVFRWPLLLAALLAAWCLYWDHRLTRAANHAYIRGTLDAIECFHAWTDLGHRLEAHVPVQPVHQRDLFDWLTSCQVNKEHPDLRWSTITRIAVLINDWPGWQGEF